MPDPTLDSRRVTEMLRGYRQAQVVMTLAELGVGDALAGGPRTTEEVARRIGADPSATARLLRAATLLGLAWEEGERFALTDLGAATLTSHGPASLVNIARLEAAFYRRWSRLAEAVRTGRRPEENARDEQEPGWVRRFTLALYDSARLSGPGIAEALAPIVHGFGDRPVRVIDVGGGHGGYSLALARRFPNVEAVVFDLPPVIEVTREIVAASGLGDRVRPVAGDFRADPLGSGYDLALLFGVLVGEDPAGSVALLRTVRAALTPGGWVLIRGHYVGRGPDGTLEDALFDLQMLLSTERGAAHASADIEAWLREAGFEPRPPIRLEPPASGRLLAGQVPLGTA